MAGAGEPQSSEATAKTAYNTTMYNSTEKERGYIRRMLQDGTKGFPATARTETADLTLTRILTLTFTLACQCRSYPCVCPWGGPSACGLSAARFAACKAKFPVLASQSCLGIFFPFLDLGSHGYIRR